jgi:hypothetical protein
MGLVFIEALITVEGTAADGMVHTLSLMAMATIAERFRRITAQLPMRSLAADSGAVPKVSTAADGANRREVASSENGPSVYRAARLVFGTRSRAMRLPAWHIKVGAGEFVSPF